MEERKFSIITVSFNSEKTIRETIEHVLNQTYNNYEYIIVDGLSQDKTVEIANEYREQFKEKGVKYTIISEKDNGIYDAMNKGIKIADGDFIGIVNSDDFYELDCLENVATEYNKNHFDICYGNLRIFDDKGSFIKTASFGKRFKRRHWNHPTMFVSKEIYNRRIYACESIFDDLDFMLWCKHQNKFKIITINKVLSNFRLGGVSSKHSWKKSMERVKIVNAIYKKNDEKGHNIENFIIELIKYLRA